MCPKCDVTGEVLQHARQETSCRAPARDIPVMGLYLVALGPPWAIFYLKVAHERGGSAQPRYGFFRREITLEIGRQPVWATRTAWLAVFWRWRSPHKSQDWR